NAAVYFPCFLAVLMRKPWAGDGNAATVGDPQFSPLGAPASNQTGPSFTPPFPAYPSGHAGFGAALFESLRDFYGTDDIAFTFVSDEYNGVTRDNLGNVRPLVPRTFNRLSEAEEENGQSRIYLGIHWSFDKTAGIEQGRRVADYIFTRIFLPDPALAISAADGTATLSWQSATGESYQIESSDSLNTGSWNPLQAPIIGNGEELSVNDKPPATEHFYRLKYWRN
ncbi:MAG: vanadium-dependent haloperoxidase, partial [Verrucomicrobia bacterium]|nr:vanadium-dependent haloperoxidase [Verrucomicrobiota bacterium]